MNGPTLANLMGREWDEFLQIVLIMDEGGRFFCAGEAYDGRDLSLANLALIMGRTEQEIKDQRELMDRNR
jgi:hypothetical protein